MTWEGWCVPVAFAAEVAAGNLKQAVGAVVRDYLLVDTSWASNLLAIFAVEEVLEGVEAEVGSRGTGVKCSLIVGGVLWLRAVWEVGRRQVGAGTLYVRVGDHGRHGSGHVPELTKLDIG